MPESRNIAVLVSKEPRPFQQLVSDSKQGLLRAPITAVLSNHPDLEPIASAAGLWFEWTPSDDLEKHFSWLGRTLRERAVDVIALARYMRILPPAIVSAFPNRIINIHPSLLPYFPGAAPYQKAHEAGVHIHGCTAHFVTEQLDEGPIILQDIFRINVGADNVDDVKRKGLDLEGKVLSRAVQLFLDDQLDVTNGKVIHRSPASAGRELE